MQQQHLAEHVKCVVWIDSAVILLLYSVDFRNNRVVAIVRNDTSVPQFRKSLSDGSYSILDCSQAIVRNVDIFVVRFAARFKRSMKSGNFLVKVLFEISEFV